MRSTAQNKELNYQCWVALMRGSHRRRLKTCRIMLPVLNGTDAEAKTAIEQLDMLALLAKPIAGTTT